MGQASSVTFSEVEIMKDVEVSGRIFNAVKVQNDTLVKGDEVFGGETCSVNHTHLI